MIGCIFVRILPLLAVGCLLATGVQAAPRIVASTFPVYQIVRNVTQGHPVSVELMIPAALGCPHDYALTPQDMRKLAAADVLVINGLGLEEFISDLGISQRGGDRVLTIVDSSAGVSGVLTQKGDDHGHQHGADVANPHLYVSPRLAARVAESIARQLADLDPAGASVYGANAAQYASRMDALAEQAAARAARLSKRRIVTQHGVFDYLARDLGLEVVAVVQAHPGQDPSAAEMMRLIEHARTAGAGAVFTEPQYPRRVAETLAREAGIPAAELDSGSTSPTDKPEQAPLDSAEQVLRRNLEILERTLGVH